MRLTPIFDTSAILNLSKRDPSDPLCPVFNRSVPAKGCPLSFVTVLELFLGLRRADKERFTHSLKAVTVANSSESGHRGTSGLEKPLNDGWGQRYDRILRAI
jgi:predicted nucleic acid-binding protein